MKSLTKRILSAVFGPKDPEVAERKPIQDIDKFPDPHWVMFIPVVSTTHIRRSDNILLREWGDLSVVVPMEFGFLVYVGQHEESWDEFPKTVREICRWAFKRKFEWVRIDRDGDVIPLLPIYQW